MGQFERIRVGELARRMSALLLTELSLDVVFERLCEVLADFVEAPVVFIALRNPDGSFLEFRHQDDRITRLVSPDLPQQALIHQAIGSGAGFINRDPAGLFAPLRIGDECIGVLVAESCALNEYTADDLMVLESVAPYVAVAIRNRMLQDAVVHERYRAEHDPLTGLANRALFIDRLTQAVRRAARTGELVGVIYADLDGFKAVNDTLGHAAGDQLLKTVAKRLCDAVRVSDTVARMGGDEFAMVLERLHNRMELDKVIVKLERGIRRPLTVADSQVEVGISIGHSIYPLDALGVDKLLECADMSMYAIKERHHRDLSA